MDVINEYIALFIPYIMRLTPVEIGLIAFVFILFILLFALGVMLREHSLLASFSILTSFILLAVTPFLIELAITRIVYPTQLNIGFNQRLEFTPQVFLVEGEIVNRSKYRLKECIITIELSPATKKPLDKLRYRLKPLIVKKETISQMLEPQKGISFQYTIDGIEHVGELQSHVNAVCF